MTAGIRHHQHFSKTQIIGVSLLLLLVFYTSESSRLDRSFQPLSFREQVQSRWTVSSSPNLLLLQLRGGSSTGKSAPASSSSSVSKKKKRKKKKKAVDGTNSSSSSSDKKLSEGKDVINKSLGKDSAEALGDAIRDRAETLRSESPLLESIDQSIYSVGWALGASDRRRFDGIASDKSLEEDVDDGGMEGSPTSVLVSYFLKSHGGAHALQCLCSLLASSAGFAALFFPTKNPMKLVLLKRTMLFAMTKHVSGLFAAALLAARAIPEVGLRKARVWMEQLALDPVSQYVFYAACVLLWLPSSSAGIQKLLIVPVEKVSWVFLVLLGPILLREAVSTVLVISDVLVLWATSSSSVGAIDMEDEKANVTQQKVEAIQKLLQMSQSLVNAFMSLLVTPSKWRSADPAMRQQILAKLTSQISLALEVSVGAIFAIDAFFRSCQFVFGVTAPTNKPTFLEVVKRLICARIYIQFLWTRKRKINKLVTNIRGGSAQLPFYILDILIDPRSSMGLEKPKPKPSSINDGENRVLTWKDYAKIAMGLDY